MSPPLAALMAFSFPEHPIKSGEVSTPHSLDRTPVAFCGLPNLHVVVVLASSGDAREEFMLREQLKMIKKELGEDKSDGTDKLLDKFKQRLEAKQVPQEALEAINSEMEKFSNLAKDAKPRVRGSQPEPSK